MKLTHRDENKAVQIFDYFYLYNKHEKVTSIAVFLFEPTIC